MHQQTEARHIIGMIVLRSEVMGLNRAFQQFMLYFLDYHMLAIDKDKDIPRAEFAGFCPAFDRRIEGEPRCSCNLSPFTVTWTSSAVSFTYVSATSLMATSSVSSSQDHT